MKKISPQGFTILELMAVMAIVLLMAVAGMVTIRSVRRADISTAASKLSAAVRYTYNTAVLNNGTYRMVMDMGSGAWWVERVDASETCGGAAVLPGEDEDEEARPADRKRGKGALSNPFDGGSMASRMWDMSAISGGAGNDGASLSAAVAEGVAAVQSGRSSSSSDDVDEEEMRAIRRERARVRDDLLRRNQLPDGISFKAVMTTHHNEPADEGQAEIYFFPSGYVERAYVYIERDEDIYTVETVPLRGIGVVHKEELNARDIVPE